MQTIGERLEEARKRKGYSIREAADATKIRGDYLHKFENNQYDIRLPEIYVRGFLRTYATYLGLPADKIINDYKALGIGKEKQGRNLSREVYGRMDISVSGPKNAQEVTGEGVEETPENEDSENPANFKPPYMTKIPGDKSLYIKMGAVVLGILVLGLFVAWGVSSASKKKDTDNVVWVQPGPSEDVLGLVAVALPAEVEVTSDNGELLYKGALKRDEVRLIPRRGTLTIACETPQNIRVEIDNRRMELKQPGTNEYLSRARISPRASR